MPQPDADPIQQAALDAARGDARAFSLLHERFSAALQRMFRRRGLAEAAADDLSQRTWVAAWQALRAGRYDPGRARFSTFVYAIAGRVFLQWRREGAAERAADVLHFDIGAADEPPLAAAEALAALQECLHSALTDTERELVQALADGRTERELAITSDISASTVHARKAAAYGKLERCMRRKGFRDDWFERDHLWRE